MAVKELRIFPTSGRTSEDASIDLGTNLITEYNISSITQNYCDYEGYVIGDDSADGDIEYNPSNPLEFVLNGYSFKVTGVGNVTGTEYGDYLTYVNSNNTISVTGKFSMNTILSYSSIVKSDHSGTVETKGLLLLKRVDDTWYIPKESRRKFRNFSLGITFDDGVVS